MYSSMFIYCTCNLLGCFLAHGVIDQVDNVSCLNKWGMELLVLNPELWKIISEGTQEDKIIFQIKAWRKWSNLLLSKEQVSNTGVHGVATKIDKLCLHFFLVGTSWESLSIHTFLQWLLSARLVWIIRDEIEFLLAIETHCKFLGFPLETTGVWMPLCLLLQRNGIRWTKNMWVVSLQHCTSSSKLIFYLGYGNTFTWGEKDSHCKSWEKNNSTFKSSLLLRWGVNLEN